MNNTLLILTLIGGGLALWVISIAIVYWDTGRRRPPSTNQWLWVGLAAVLPGVGFFAYLLVRMFTEFRSPAERGMGQRWVTRVKRPQGVPGQGSTIPATDLLDRPGGARPAAQYPAGPPAVVPSVQSGPLWLLVLDGPERGKSFPLRGLPLVIGRGTEVQIALDADIGISRRHAEIYARDDFLRIRDLGSTHGTFINGKPVSDEAIRPGDQIAFGQTVLQVQEARRGG